MIESVQQRVAHWTHLPLANQEDTQVLRYVDGQNYKAHYDSSDTFDSPRVATVLLYLSGELQDPPSLLRLPFSKGFL